MTFGIGEFSLGCWRISVLHFGRWMCGFDGSESFQHLVRVLRTLGYDPRVASSEENLLIVVEVKFCLARDDVAARLVVSRRQRLAFIAWFLFLPHAHRQGFTTGQILLSHFAYGSRLRGHLDN